MKNRLLSIIAITISICSFVYINKINKEFREAIDNTSTMCYKNRVETTRLTFELREIKKEIPWCQERYFVF